MLPADLYARLPLLERLEIEMGLTVIDHALAGVVLTGLRDKTTPPATFRHLTKTVSTIIAVEAARTLPTHTVSVDTPVELTSGKALEVGLITVPILRAGLGMLESVLDLIPEARVGYLGLERSEDTAEAGLYYSKLPDVFGKTVWMLDPMLATGGSASRAASILYHAGARHVSLLCIVAAPEGVAFLTANHPDLHIITASLDRELNGKKYILPGLGDFGDRLFGTT